MTAGRIIILESFTTRPVKLTKQRKTIGWRISNFRKTKPLVGRADALPTAAFLLIACLITVAGSGVGALDLGHEFLPPEHWSYDALERFESLGLVTLPSSRLYTRDEVAGYGLSIRANVDAGRPLSPRDRFNLERLEEEFSRVQARLGVSRSERAQRLPILC